MVSVLLCALEGLGAAAHSVGLAEALRARGHRVTVVTSTTAAPPFRAAGFPVHPVPEPPMPPRNRLLPPLLQRAQQLIARVQRNLVDPLAGQWVVVERLLPDTDVVVTDALFLGASMLSIRDRATRPPVVALGFFPPWIPDPAVAPYGMGLAPAEGPGSRVRTAAVEAIASRAIALVSRSFGREVERAFGVRYRGDLRASPAIVDAWAQLTVPRFEYPRTALPASFRFVGPLRPPADDLLPEWWDPEAEPRVVAVRSTSSDALLDLVMPAVAAFGGSDSTLLIAGARRDQVAALHPGPLPGNVHFEEHLPWSRLRARSTVVIGDGDYLHAQHALRRGIPLVVAGTLETEVETAARVAWSGAGLDLRSGRPTPDALRAAVERIRGNEAFLAAAARIAVQIAASDAEGAIADLVEAMAAVPSRLPDGSPR